MLSTLSEMESRRRGHGRTAHGTNLAHPTHAKWVGSQGHVSWLPSGGLSANAVAGEG